MSNLIEAIQQKCNYIRDEVIPMYEQIGPVGNIGKMFLQNEVRNAESVIASGDVVQMVSTLQSLTETCESAV